MRIRTLINLIDLAINKAYNFINRTPTNRTIFSYNWLFSRHIVKSFKTHKDLFKDKVVCDYGAGSAPYYKLINDVLKQYIALDFYKKTTVDDKLTRKPLASDGAVPEDLHQNADVIISNQVFVELDDINLYFDEMVKLTRPGAHIFITMPFIQTLGANDKFRVSPFLINKKLEERNFEAIEYSPCGHFFSGFGMTLNMAIILKNKYDFKTGEVKLSQRKGLLFAPLFAVINVISLILDKIMPLRRVPANFLIVAKKNGANNNE